MLTNKSDIWKRPDDSIKQDKEVLYWKTLVWDNLPDHPASDEYNEQYTEFLTKLSRQMDTIAKKEKIFDIKCLLMANDLIDFYKWNLYGSTSLGTALGFDKTPGLLKIPETAEGIHSDMIYKGIGVSRAERKIAGLTFVSADDPKLKKYEGKDDDGKTIRYFEIDDELHYAINRDTLNNYDPFARTFVFYKNELVLSSSKALEETKKELIAYITDKDSAQSADDKERYAKVDSTIDYADMVYGELDIEGSLEKKYLFTEVKGEDAYETEAEKDKAKQIAYTSYSQLARIMGVSNYDMSVQARTAVDISVKANKNIAENWFKSFFSSLPADKMKELTHPLLVAIKNNEYNEDSGFYKSAVSLDQNIIAPKDRTYSNDLSMMARCFSAYIYDTALEKGINNVFLTGVHNESKEDEKLMYPVDGDRARINKAMKKLIESAKKNVYLMERKEEPLVELTESTRIRKHTENIFRHGNEDENEHKMR